MDYLLVLILSPFMSLMMFELLSFDRLLGFGFLESGSTGTCQGFPGSRHDAS